MPVSHDLHEYLKELVQPSLNAYGAKARLARMWGVRQSYINQWLSGRHNPGIDKLPALAEFLGIPLERLFSGVRKPKYIPSAVGVVRPAPLAPERPTEYEAQTVRHQLREVQALLVQLVALTAELLQISTACAVSRGRRRKRPRR